MTSSNPDGSQTIDPPRDAHFLAEVQRELARLDRELHIEEATVDLLFLAYLLKTSRFGFFSFGPITIDVRLIEDLVLRTAIRSNDPKAGTKTRYGDDCVRFFSVLSDEVELSGRRRIDEVHFLLAFMRVGRRDPRAGVWGAWSFAGGSAVVRAGGRGAGGVGTPLLTGRGSRVPWCTREDCAELDTERPTAGKPPRRTTCVCASVRLI